MMHFNATHCPRCTGRFMLDGEEWFCINCSYRPYIIPLGLFEELSYKKVRTPRFDYRNAESLNRTVS